jgi:hypothetical protein
VRQPDVLLFDEPLSHLDGAQKSGLRAEIKRLQKEAPTGSTRSRGGSSVRSSRPVLFTALAMAWAALAIFPVSGWPR